MSDPPAPKPKPGSLRDRIAAFEHKPAAPNGPTPPAPRPKGALHTWKPRPVSPPPAPSGETVSNKTPGMSASDAKESIGRGGTLKERMAALQGTGAFGGGAPPPPVPKADKPKWKPPPQVVKTPPIDGEEEEDAKKDEGEDVEGAPVVHRVKAPAALENVLGKSPSPAAEGEAEQHEAEGEKEGSGEDGEQRAAFGRDVGGTASGVATKRVTTVALFARSYPSLRLNYRFEITQSRASNSPITCLRRCVPVRDVHTLMPLPERNHHARQKDACAIAASRASLC
ncbi:hypothetical protein EVG20_g3797 [Dentipellis fragilis]|uniref:Uncharacterized protein n=1 Tax=Dentipellis fragilis TaxID=205917 RepID=A0A4Y9Z1S6_9AGAM|nr:hypothetical protein EVG20_g3797 [Dentipellis fragilis]